MCLFTNRRSYSACIMVLPMYPFDLPFFLHMQVMICGRHIMALVRDIKIADALLILCLLAMLLNEFDIAEIEALWLSCIEVWGARFTSIFSVFSVMARWIAEMLFMLFLAYISVEFGQKIAEYEVYWLMGVPIINPWGVRFTSIFSLFSIMAGWIAKMLFMLFFAYIAQNIAEYEVYWLMGVPIINP